ncbi:MAG: glycosyltransferase family 39 protein [Gammaproteobacteria bacterium]|nr:glycosyltransferase family 39 protein [Gammaproteobacteria bacterium]
MKTQQQHAAAALVAGILILTLAPIALRPLFNLNEGLYAEIPREMLRHNWLMPRLDGMPYLEKPPIFYWLVMIFYKIFGVGKFAARLPSALAALGTLWVVLRFARPRMTEPLWPPVILFTSIGFYLMSQLAMFDMTFTFFHTITLLAFYAYMEEPGRPGRLYLAAAASALACLTKGLIGIVLPGLIVLAFLASQRRTIRWRPFLAAWLIFLTVALPWHVWMIIHVPHFFDRYIVQEHFDRFLGTLKPADYRDPPFYYNLEHLLFGIFPWTPFLLAALWRRWPYDALDRFLLIWAAVYVIFFTLSKTSSSYYTLPAMPALALFVGRALPDLAGRLLGRLVALFTALTLVAVIAVPWLPHPDTRIYLAGMGLAYLAFFLIAGADPRRIWRMRLTALGSLAGLAGLFLAYTLIHPARFASKGLAEALKPELTPHADVFVVDRYEDLSSFDFYLDRPIYVLNPAQGDLYYGIRHDKQVTRLITGRRLEYLLNHRHVFIAGSRTQRPVWEKLGRFRVVAANRHDVVVENILPESRR